MDMQYKIKFKPNFSTVYKSSFVKLNLDFFFLRQRERDIRANWRKEARFSIVSFQRLRYWQQNVKHHRITSCFSPPFFTRGRSCKIVIASIAASGLLLARTSQGIARAFLFVDDSRTIVYREGDALLHFLFLISALPRACNYLRVFASCIYTRFVRTIR